MYEHFKDDLKMFLAIYDMVSSDKQQFIDSSVSDYMKSLGNIIFEACIMHFNDTGWDNNSIKFLRGCSLKDIEIRNAGDITNAENMLQGCVNAEYIKLSDWDTSGVINMHNMFSWCCRLSELDLSRFNTSGVIDMYNMFNNCRNLRELDLSRFNTSNVKSMSGMFYFCSSLKSLNLSSFDTSNVVNMAEMFSGCSSLKSLDLSNFDTSSVMYMAEMFNECTSLESLDLSNFDTSNVVNMAGMFSGCNSLKKVIIGPNCLNLRDVIPEGVEVIIKENTTGTDDDILYEKCPTIYKFNHTREECIEYMKQFNN